MNAKVVVLLVIIALIGGGAFLYSQSQRETPNVDNIEDTLLPDIKSKPVGGTK